MIEWISRNGDVRERLRLDTTRSYTMGRAADNDFVIDDPYVAAYHARLQWDGSQWMMQDLGTVNGLLLSDKIVRQAPLSHGNLIGIGQSSLRWRDAGAALAPERKLPPQELSARNPWLALLVGAALLVIGALNYVTSIPPLPANFWFGVFREPVLLSLLWTISWAVLSRVFAGNPWFTLHLSIAMRAGLGVLLLPWLVQNLAYAFSAPVLLPIAEIGVYLIIAWAVLRHLTIAFGQLRNWQIIGLIVLALLPVVSGIMNQIDRRSQWFDTQLIKRLPDPAWQLVPSKPVDALFSGINAIRPKIDAMRTQSDVGDED